MTQWVVLLYGVLCGFVLSADAQNRRAMRPNGKAVMMSASLAFGFSAGLGVLLFGWAVLGTLGLVPLPVLT